MMGKLTKPPNDIPDTSSNQTTCALYFLSAMRAYCKRLWYERPISGAGYFGREAIRMTGRTSMSTANNICFRMICSFILLAAINVHATEVNYTLENVILDDSTQMTGTFSWTFDIGDFENGVGQFTSLDIPHTSHDHTDLDATIDIVQSIEITLPNSTHDDGVDVTLVLLEPLTPTTSSPINLVRSKYEIGGNGFHDGLFLSGSISPDTDAVIFKNGFEPE
jgi:hypothetical protein